MATSEVLINQIFGKYDTLAFMQIHKGESLVGNLVLNKYLKFIASNYPIQDTFGTVGYIRRYSPKEWRVSYCVDSSYLNGQYLFFSAGRRNSVFEGQEIFLTVERLIKVTDQFSNLWDIVMPETMNEDQVTSTFEMITGTI